MVADNYNMPAPPPGPGYVICKCKRWVDQTGDGCKCVALAAELLPFEPGAFADEYDTATRDALNEVRRARELWPNKASSAHEQYAILLEEMDELKAHVWTNQKRRDLAKMRDEAIQVAAMAIRFAAECCTEERGRK